MKRRLGVMLVFMGIMITLDALSMDVQLQKQKKKLYVGPIYPPNSFLFLVMAEKLDNRALIENNDKFFGVNQGDLVHGLTPLHYLVSRNDATVEQVKALLRRGADPTICTRKKFYRDGTYELGHDVYRYTMTWEGRSPAEMFFGNDYELQYLGNKEVRDYIFHEILHKKLSAVVLERENEEIKQELIQEMKNCHDGVTQLHSLVTRKDTTVGQVKILLSRGVDPIARTRKRILYEDVVREPGLDAHRYAMIGKRISPVEMSCENAFELQYLGNKEVLDYIFCEILYTKLLEIIVARKNEKRRQEHMQAVEKKQQGKWQNMFPCGH